MHEGLLIVLMVGLHLVALAAAAVLIILALRGGDADGPSDDDGRGGIRNDPPRRPLGGPPLLNAAPAGLRLRGPQRLADAYPIIRRPHRRPRAPAGPSRSELAQVEDR